LEGLITVSVVRSIIIYLSEAFPVMSHEPLRATLEDLQSSETRGKWWLIGAAWSGDPLVDEKRKRQSAVQPAKEVVDEQSQVLLELARKQGMNTDIRRSIFIVLMSSEVSGITFASLPTWILDRTMLMLVSA
jgi:nucleolar MIF4G domain-containing protein 1